MLQTTKYVFYAQSNILRTREEFRRLYKTKLIYSKDFTGLYLYSKKTGCYIGKAHAKRVERGTKFI